MWETRLTFTNWTFGLWWGVIGHKWCFGVDLGPFEAVYRKSHSRKKREREKRT